jgi:DNA-binding NarL/FixJ family response regulator
MRTPIKIGLVDPQEVVCKGLGALLNNYEDFTVVGQGHDMESARYICAKYNPQVLITDFLAEGLEGINLLAKLHEEFPEVRLFVLTAQSNKPCIDQTLKIGVLGYWFKNARIGDLVNAIRCVKDNQPSLAPDVLRSIIRTMVAPPEVGRDLTNREYEVLSWMVKGFNNREIANELSISYSTVKNHVSKVLSKLEVSNRVEAVTIALENQLVNAS